MAEREPATKEETLDVLFDISQILHTGLDRETLEVLVGLTENGVNPEALATVVKELRREGAALRAAGAEADAPPSTQTQTSPPGRPEWRSA